jgi:hypothetical protein
VVLDFCLAAGHVSLMCLFFEAFAVRLRGALQCSLRPLLSFPCLLGPAGRRGLLSRRSSLALFGHSRLMLHFR